VRSGFLSGIVKKQKDGAVLLFREKLSRFKHGLPSKRLSQESACYWRIFALSYTTK
jgi:hypothetical protein